MLASVSGGCEGFPGQPLSSDSGPIEPSFPRQLILIKCNQMARHDVLADPVRLAVARRLARGRASASEVARSVGVHLNTARAHLAALAEAGVASREHDPPGGRGRP